MNNPAEVLQKKRTELMADLARLQGEAQDAGETKQPTDEAAADESTGETLEEVTLKSQTLEQVEDALKRVAAGTYGKCVTCGRPIPAARLEALPWTPFCLEDQEKLDSRSAAN